MLNFIIHQLKSEKCKSGCLPEMNTHCINYQENCLQPRVTVEGTDEQWCADLCDMSNIAQYNDGTNFMLTVIDVFSKKADAEPTRNKSGEAVTQAFKRILDRAEGRKPQNLETDKGKEFWNGQGLGEGPPLWTSLTLDNVDGRVPADVFGQLSLEMCRLSACGRCGRCPHAMCDQDRGP